MISASTCYHVSPWFFGLLSSRLLNSLNSESLCFEVVAYYPPFIYFLCMFCAFSMQKEEYCIIFTRPSMEISTKTHLLELSTMIHVVRNQIRCMLVNERPRDISLARLRDLTCCVYQSVNRDEKTHSAFQITWLEDKSI